jgi:hypothetical protein
MAAKSCLHRRLAVAGDGTLKNHNCQRLAAGNIVPKNPPCHWMAGSGKRAPREDSCQRFALAEMTHCCQRLAADNRQLRNHSCLRLTAEQDTDMSLHRWQVDEGRGVRQPAEDGEGGQQLPAVAEEGEEGQQQPAVAEEDMEGQPHSSWLPQRSEHMA